MIVHQTGAAPQDPLRLPKQARLRYEGCVEQAIGYIRQSQLLDRSLWHRFVEQFRQPDADFDNAWRGEYWGKMMMGACYLCRMTQDDALYEILEETVRDMLGAQDEAGRISTYAVSHELRGWDLWCRKYVMVGMEYFLEICRDPSLAGALRTSLCRQMDAILEKLGPGKKPLCEASDLYRGLNSSSILEPVVVLYRLTGKQAYLDLALHIVSWGGTSVCDLFTLALEDQLYPYQYPITKAYEMISCFEGLIELWRVTGDETCKTAALRFVNKLLESDFTVIGSSGCTHEFLDHATNRQANEEAGPLMQETCVTVSLMKLLWQAARLTGEMRYIDAFEQAFYNAYLGAFNTNQVIPEDFRQENAGLVLEPLPFDSYSPLTSGFRGVAVGGFQSMSDGHYYGCCACIGALGCGLFTRLQLTETEEGPAMTLYAAGSADTVTPKGQPLRLVTQTDYPSDRRVTITLHLPQAERFRLLLRIPGWSVQTEAAVNGSPVQSAPGPLALERVWCDGDCITLDLDFRIRSQRPAPYDHDVLMTGILWDRDYIVPVYDRAAPGTRNHIALQRGPLTLAAQQSLGWTPGKPIHWQEGLLPEAAEVPAAGPCLVSLHLPQPDSAPLVLTDYASAGKRWGEGDRIAAWLPICEPQRSLASAT